MTYAIMPERAGFSPYPVLLNTDGSITSFPPDPANPDYSEYIAWCAAGGIAQPYVAPKAVTP